MIQGTGAFPWAGYSGREHDEGGSMMREIIVLLDHVAVRILSVKEGEY